MQPNIDKNSLEYIYIYPPPHLFPCRTAGNIKLKRFVGRPTEPSPKARIRNLFGYGLSTLGSSPALSCPSLLLFPFFLLEESKLPFHVSYTIIIIIYVLTLLLFKDNPYPSIATTGLLIATERRFVISSISTAALETTYPPWKWTYALVMLSFVLHNCSVEDVLGTH